MTRAVGPQHESAASAERRPSLDPGGRLNLTGARTTGCQTAAAPQSCWKDGGAVRSLRGARR